MTSKSEPATFQCLKAPCKLVIAILDNISLKFIPSWTSLVVQRLRLQAPSAGGPGSTPGQGTRPHMLQLKIPCAAKIEESSCHN